MSGISPCDHKEADTRLFLHVQHARSSAIIETVDTDVVIIAIFCFKDLGIERLWQGRILHACLPCMHCMPSHLAKKENNNLNKYM